MNTFLELNKDKLKFIYARISLILLGLVSIFLAIAYFTGNFPDKHLLIDILLTTGIGCPIIIMLIAYFGWISKRRKRRQAFSKTPFDLVDKIGFYGSNSNIKSKWNFTEQIKEGKVNGFILLLDISNENSFIIELKAPVEWKKLDKSELNRLNERMKQQNIEFRIGSLVKLFDIRRPTLQTAFDLKRELEDFTNLLIEEGFEPRK